MIKYTRTDAFAWRDLPARIIPVSRKGVDAGFFKAAGSGFLESVRRRLRPVKGHTPAFVFAMGAGEYYGSNSNADYWPARAADYPLHLDPGRCIKVSAGLKERAHTFEEARVYREHRRRGVAPKGFVFSSHFNEEMGRIETIPFLQDSVFARELKKMEGGGLVPFSMGAKVSCDFCSVCGNRAQTRSTYCKHLAKKANLILQDGHQVVAINEHPTFFDLSVVALPADRIAYGLSTLTPTPAERDSPFSLSEKTAHPALERIIRKMAEIEKRIEAEGADIKGLKLKRKPPEGLSDAIRLEPAANALRTLQRLGILLPPEAFFAFFAPEALAGASRRTLALELPFTYRLLSKELPREDELGVYAPGIFGPGLPKEAARQIQELYGLAADILFPQLALAHTSGGEPTGEARENPSSLGVGGRQHALYQLAALSVGCGTSLQAALYNAGALGRG